MKVVNLVSQVFFLLITVLFLIYFLTGYDSAFEADQNRFKCQSSLLGLQTEIIEAYFFNNFSNERISLMIPYVIKNC